jgi:hypothetical protein
MARTAAPLFFAAGFPAFADGRARVFPAAVAVRPRFARRAALLDGRRLRDDVVDLAMMISRVFFTRHKARAAWPRNPAFWRV